MALNKTPIREYLSIADAGRNAELYNKHIIRSEKVIRIINKGVSKIIPISLCSLTNLSRFFLPYEFLINEENNRCSLL